MGVADRIVEHAGRLTAAERRVAAVIADEPETVAFGTVSLIAGKAKTSGPTVVRFAVKLGYGGFVQLQADAQQELSALLGPARERIRQQPPADLLARVAAVEEHNVRRTLSSIPPAQFDAVVGLLADQRRAVWVLPGDVTEPIGTTLAARLSQLRRRVTLVGGSEIVAARVLAGIAPGDTLFAVDIRRYESWLIRLTRWAVDSGAVLVAATDGPLSPLTADAAETLTIAAEGVGPFDSMTSGVALANALVAGVAVRVRAKAASRLDRVEAAWTATGALLHDPTGSVRRPSGPAGRLDRGGDDHRPGTRPGAGAGAPGQEPEWLARGDGNAEETGGARAGASPAGPSGGQTADGDRSQGDHVHPAPLARLASGNGLEPLDQADQVDEG